LRLDEEDLSIICDKKINGHAFFKTTEKKFLSYGLKEGPTTNLLDFAKDCKTKKLKAFSLYKTTENVDKVFNKYGIGDSHIHNILFFTPPSVKINDDDKDLELCINMIKCKINFIGMTTGSNESVCCEYISIILCVSIIIAKRMTGE
jgi:hypothetical protein